MTFIKYIKPSKEVYFQFYSSPTKVEVESREDALRYLEKFYEDQKKRLDSFKKDLDLFANNL